MLAGETIPPSEFLRPAGGYLVSGIAATKVGAQQCAVVRFVSRECEFCRNEVRAWDQFGQALARLGCRPMGLVPSEATAMSPALFGFGADEQLSLVSMDWVEGFYPRVTPTTLIVNGNGTILWYRVGELQAGDLSAATKAVGRWRARQPQGGRK